MPEIIGIHGMENMTMDVIFAGSKDDALALEFKYRPSENIGWNRSKGGSKPTGYAGRNGKRIVSEETKRKISITNKGKGLGIPNPNKGRTDFWTDEQKKHIGSFHKGKKISDEQKEQTLKTRHLKKYKMMKHIAVKHRDKELSCVFQNISALSQFFLEEKVPVGHSTIKAAARRKSSKFKRTDEWSIDYENSHPLIGVNNYKELYEREEKLNAPKKLNYNVIKVSAYHKDRPENILEFASKTELAKMMNITSSSLGDFIKNNPLGTVHKNSGFIVTSVG